MDSSTEGFEYQDETPQHEPDLELGSSTSGETSEDEVDGSSRSDLPTSASDGGLTTRAKFLPVTMTFKNLFYSVKVRKGKNPFQKKYKKTLLKDLHGEMRPGEITAIMGPSGTVPSSPKLARPSHLDNSGC
jgi:ABC-type multidrug transport system fused ATPase/permease subunit